MPARILYCHCAYARVVPAATKGAVLEGLAGSGADFDAVPDLCEMAARQDPRLQELSTEGPIRIAACYPRAVKWLFAAAGATLSDEHTMVFNMRDTSAEDVLTGLLDRGAPGEESR